MVFKKQYSIIQKTTPKGKNFTHRKNKYNQKFPKIGKISGVIK